VLVVLGRTLAFGPLVIQLGLGLVACGAPPTPLQDHQVAPPVAGTEPSVLDRPVQRAARARPIEGGTLLVTRNGRTAVASDPDRGRIFLVDLEARSVVSVATQPGDEPARGAEGPDGTLFVLARATGVVLVVSPGSASVAARFPVCHSPRGIAYDDRLGLLHVACRSGLLLSLDPVTGAVLRRLKLVDDLRDVVPLENRLLVTRFRSATTLLVGDQGVLETKVSFTLGASLEARVAYRAVPMPGHMAMLVHQNATIDPLPPGPSSTTPGPVYYESDCRSGLLSAMLTLWDTTGGGKARIVWNVVGPLDLAVDRTGERLALLSAGNRWWLGAQPATVLTVDLTDGFPDGEVGARDCSPVEQAVGTSARPEGEPVAIVMDAQGRWIVQSREPAALVLEDGTRIDLDAESRFDSGFAMFYMNAGTGVSCASCHPEGADDGHAWNFGDVGLRRTQPLHGGVTHRAPFHWGGELATFDDLFQEVMVRRLAVSAPVSSAHKQALADWLDAIPGLPPGDDLDGAAVERGRAIFEGRAGCVRCHLGPDSSDRLRHDVGTGGSFVTPSLRGVAFRAPLMHDGCASTLRDRFGPCGGALHGSTELLSASEIDDLVTYMHSL
jgi:hypothetical protein